MHGGLNLCSQEVDGPAEVKHIPAKTEIVVQARLSNSELNQVTGSFHFNYLNNESYKILEEGEIGLRKVSYQSWSLPKVLGQVYLDKEQGKRETFGDENKINKTMGQPEATEVKREPVDGENGFGTN